MKANEVALNTTLILTFNLSLVLTLSKVLPTLSLPIKRLSNTSFCPPIKVPGTLPIISNRNHTPPSQSLSHHEIIIRAVPCRPSLSPAVPLYPKHTCLTLWGPPSSPRAAALHFDRPGRTTCSRPVLSRALVSPPCRAPRRLGTLAVTSTKPPQRGRPIF